MLRQLIKDTGIYGITGILSKSMSIFLVPFYTRVLTPGDYGTIDMMAVVAAIVSVTVPLQITQAVARFLADSECSKETKIVGSVGFFFTVVTFSIFYLLAYLFSGSIASIVLEGNESAGIVKVAALSMYCNGLFYYVQNQLRWLLMPKKYATVSLFHLGLTLPLTILLVLIFKMGVYGVFLARIIGGFCAFLLGFYFSRSSYTIIFSFKKLKDMLLFSLPLVSSGVGIFFINSAQKIFVKSLIGLSSLGLFGVGARIASVVILTMKGFKTALTPLIYSNYRDRQTPSKLAQIFRYFTFYALFTSMALSFFSKEILMVLTTPAYYSAYYVVPYLVIASFLFTMGVFAPGIAIAKKTKLIASINIIVALVSIAASYTFISLFGILGAAVATLVVGFLKFVITMMYSQKYYYVPHNFKLLTMSSLVGAAFLIIGIGGFKDVNLGNILFKSVLLVVFPVFLIMLKLVSLKEIRYYLGKIKKKEIKIRDK